MCITWLLWGQTTPQIFDPAPLSHWGIFLGKDSCPLQDSLPVCFFSLLPCSSWPGGGRVVAGKKIPPSAPYQGPGNTPFSCQ